MEKYFILHYKKVFILFYMLFLGYGYCSIAQTDIVIRYYNDTEDFFTLGKSAKIYFNSTDLIIDEGDSFITNILISDIQRINVISESQTSICQNNAGVKDMLIYPNPAYDHISVSNLNAAKTTVYVYSLSGQMLLKKELEDDGNIDISNLVPGLYVVRINERTFKLSKL